MEVLNYSTTIMLALSILYVNRLTEIFEFYFQVKLSAQFKIRNRDPTTIKSHSTTVFLFKSVTWCIREQLQVASFQQYYPSA